MCRRENPMRLKLLALTLVCLLLAPIGCNETPDQVARDTIATGNGLISAGQAQYLDSCKANPTQGVCVMINHGVDLLNIAITSLETYCGFNLSPTPPAADTKCAPVPNAKAGLDVAISNLSQIISELTPLVNKSAAAGKKTALLNRFKGRQDVKEFSFAELQSLKLEGM